MAFKKGASKKKKGKGKKGRKDAWNLEGGQFVDESNARGDAALPNESEGPGDQQQRKSRYTQEKDERIRRGMMKIEVRKLKRGVEKKMAKRIKFSDVVENDDLADSNSSSSGKNHKSVDIISIEKKIRPKSALSVLDRLRHFVSVSSTSTLASDKIGSDYEVTKKIKKIRNSSDSDYEDDKDASSGTKQPDENSEPNVEDGVEEDSEHVVAGDEDEDDNSSVGDDDVEDGKDRATTLQHDVYDLMFNLAGVEEGGGEGGRGKAPAVPEKPPLQLLNEFSDFQLYGSLSPWAKTAGTSKQEFQSLGDISGLPKMWREERTKKFIATGRGERGGGEGGGGDVAITQHVLPALTNYCDAFLEGRDFQNDEAMLSALLTHACVHTVRARMKVVKHNQKIKKRSMELAIAAVADKENGSGSGGSGGSGHRNRAGKAVSKAAKESLLRDATSQAGEHYQDQGFCRPRVLILCPFRGTAKRCVDEIVRVLGPGRTSVANRDKFEEEFGPPDDDDEEDSDSDGSDDDSGSDGEEEEGENKKKRKRKKNNKKKKMKKESKPSKPDDWNALFKNTNVDDDFKFGIQINPGQGKKTSTDTRTAHATTTRGAYVRLFTDFYQSDVIIASPIGLRFIIEKGESGGSKNADFLSSLEVVILHQADVMYMQNWDHVEFVLQHTNKLCEVDRGTDFSRVRPYFLEGKAAEHRQLVFTSHFNDPGIQSCFRSHASSLAGSVRLKKQWGDGCLSHVASRVRQVFQRVPCHSIATQEDDRFNFFVDTVLNQVLRMEQSHTLIVTPSYLSFVRIRNELQRREANAVYVSEYSRDSEVSRGRSRFFHGQKHIMLFSGRAHFFRRYLLRGANHIIFYSLPEYAHFYPELVNRVGDTSSGGGDGGLGSSSCLVLFTQYEKMALERMVGMKRAAHMTASKKNTFMFC